MMTNSRDAAQIVKTTPLIARERATPDIDGAIRRGWFNRPTECALVLKKMTGGKQKTGAAFGRSWPWIEVGEGLLSPGLPVVISIDERKGPDAVYRQKGSKVFREAAGRESVLFSTKALTSVPGEGFDALWFDDTARFLVSRGVLEVEDLFCRMVMPVCRGTIEKHLVRQRRCDPEIMEHIPNYETTDRAPSIQIARAVEATAPTWKDPETFFRRGVGFDEVTVSDDRLRAKGKDRPAIDFSFDRNALGWRAVSRHKQFPFKEMAAHSDGSYVIVTGTLSAEINPLAAGMRERLAFDLRSFLVALAESSN